VGQYVQVTTDVGGQWSSKVCGTVGLCGSGCIDQCSRRWSSKLCSTVSLCGSVCAGQYRRRWSMVK